MIVPTQPVPASSHIHANRIASSTEHVSPILANYAYLLGNQGNQVIYNGLFDPAGSHSLTHRFRADVHVYQKTVLAIARFSYASGTAYVDCTAGSGTTVRYTVPSATAGSYAVKHWCVIPFDFAAGDTGAQEISMVCSNADLAQLLLIWAPVKEFDSTIRTAHLRPNWSNPSYRKAGLLEGDYIASTGSTNYDLIGLWYSRYYSRIYYKPNRFGWVNPGTPITITAGAGWVNAFAAYDSFFIGAKAPEFTAGATTETCTVSVYVASISTCTFRVRSSWSGTSYTSSAFTTTGWKEWTFSMRNGALDTLYFEASATGGNAVIHSVFFRIGT